MLLHIFIRKKLKVRKIFSFFPYLQNETINVLRKKEWFVKIEFKIMLNMISASKYRLNGVCAFSELQKFIWI